MHLDEKIVAELYRNSQMGIITLEKLNDCCKDEKFKKFLIKQLQGYDEITKQINALIKDMGFKKVPITRSSKLKTRLMITMKNNHDPQTIAKMLIIGSTMGIIKLQSQLNRLKTVHPDILFLIERLLCFEEESMKQLKKFL